MVKYRYAAHYLQIGNKIASAPLLSVHDDAGYTLETFSCEVASTYFYSGTLILYNDAYPIEQTASLVIVPLIDLVPIVERITGWQLLLPRI